MNIDGVNNGIVLDHISAGRAMDIYKYLELDKLECSVAIIMNVTSNRMGRKDIIKIDAPIELNFDAIGYVDPDITVNIIRDGVLTEKRRIHLPERIVNVIKCRNPRCITSVEPDLDHVFLLADEKTGVYRCLYCDTISKHHKK